MSDAGDKYILDGKTAVPEPDLIKWGQWLEKANRQVNQTYIGDDIRVSTVFLGINHAWRPDEPLALFETMVFGGPLDLEMDRYSTWDSAEQGHAAMCKRVHAAIDAMRETTI